LAAGVLFIGLFLAQKSKAAVVNLTISSLMQAFKSVLSEFGCPTFGVVILVIFQLNTSLVALPGTGSSSLSQATSRVHAVKVMAIHFKKLVFIILLLLDGELKFIPGCCTLTGTFRYSSLLGRKENIF